MLSVARICNICKTSRYTCHQTTLSAASVFYRLSFTQKTQICLSCRLVNTPNFRRIPFSTLSSSRHRSRCCCKYMVETRHYTIDQGCAHSPNLLRTPVASPPHRTRLHTHLRSRMNCSMACLISFRDGFLSLIQSSHGGGGLVAVTEGQGDKRVVCTAPGACAVSLE
jgi:hypothetical protein